MNKTIEKKERSWILKSLGENREAVTEIARELGINPIVARLLYTRGYTDVESAKSFIYMESEIICNPFLMKDVDRATDRIRLAIERNEPITVYGDYDVDGVTAVCTLYLYLEAQGADVSYYIPNRAGEGYGVSASAIDAIKEQGTKLIITVDTGITANDEVLYAREAGIDVIVTDHHECRTDIPDAAAVVNPHRPDCPYPFKELAGVGVVFKLISAYEERFNGGNRIAAAKRIFSMYADLVAIGTIADVMPIREENRIIVRYGLEMIESTDRTGLAALIEAASGKTDTKPAQKKKKSKITSGYIGYTLAPRINAAGRIKTASIAVDLFLSKNASEARLIAEELCRTNKERQAEENKIMLEAYKRIEELGIENDPVIVLDADSWHHGVIGIVSSRITEKYSRPSILVSFEGNDPNSPSPDDVGKGSGRSIKGMNLVDALCYCSDHLVKFGGHELAAGLSVTRGELEAFRAKINEYARNNLSQSDMTPTVEADCEVEFSDISLSLAKSLQILEPYGVGNPVPVFIMRGVHINELSGISDGKHTKLVLSNGRHTLSAMYFSNSPSSIGVYVGDKVDLLFNVDINEWAGKENVQLIIRDMKLTEQERSTYAAEKRRFEEIHNGAPISSEEDAIPSREDFAAVYKLLLGSQRAGVCSITHRDLLSRLRQEPARQMNYSKLKIIIMVLRELNLVSIEEFSEDNYKFSIHYTSTKTELDKSNLLRKLRSQISRNG